MEKQLQKEIKKVAFILMVFTIIWVILTGISMSQVKSSWSDTEYLRWVSKPDIFYTLNYINATIFTFIAIVFYTVLFRYLYEKSKLLGLLGFVFIPVYGVLNLICYSMQITIVPSIANHTLISSGDILFVSQLIQSKSGTLIGFINGLAYAILGVPSIIYGYMLIKDMKKLSVLFILLNGILCIVGIIGFMIKNNIMSNGVMLGGIVFLISLVVMVLEFRNNALESTSKVNK
ncbi:MAG: hypothetical protein MJA84_10595 [Firmicutes bacterium]|nr:hypothetical protein [Bacillota bacterium]